MKKQIVLVTGATGAQGGSVARALLANNTFAVRALTRNPGSAKAASLKALGAEIVSGDLNDTESIRRAVKDCYGVFGVTNFWEHFEQEYQQGKNLIDVVNEMNVQHFILHTLPDYNRLSNGELPTPHCDMKAALQRYCQQLGLPATYLQPAFYYENFHTFFPLQKSQDDTWYFGFPQGNTRLAMVCAEDIGGIAATIFDHPKEYTGRTVGAVGADNTCYEYAAVMSRVLGVPVEYKYIPVEVYADLGFPGDKELANMFEVQRRYITNRQIDLIESYGLNPHMQTFENWVKNNKDVFVEMMAEKEAITV